MAIVQPVQQPNIYSALMQGLGAYSQVKGIQQQELAGQRAEEEYQRKKQERISETFAQERAETAAQMRGKSPEEKVTILSARVDRLRQQGKDPSHTERLLNMYQQGVAGKQGLQTARSMQEAEAMSMQAQELEKADAAVEEAYQTGITQGRIKAPDVKQGYRPASQQEKLAFGITDPEPYQISPQGKISPVKGRGQTINVSTGQQPEFQVGTIPKGYALKKVKGEPVLIPIKGGPVESKSVADKKKDTMKAERTGTTATLVQDDIERLTKLVETQPWYDKVTGIGGEIFSNVPGSARKDAEALKTTIGANIGFDRLQRMREESKTGGALGAVSEREMKQLESTMGALDFQQSDEQLLYNLSRLNKIYSGIIEKARAYPNADKFGFGVQATPVGEQTQQAPQMPEEIKQRYY